MQMNRFSGFFQVKQRRKVMEVQERSVIQRHLAIVAVLLLLLIGPIFGPIPGFLGGRFGIETAVIIMLFTFIVGFSIILTVILRFDEMRSDTLREKLGRLGWGWPSRVTAIIVAVIVGLAWGALFLSSTLQFDPDANLAELSLFRLAAILIAVFGAIQEDLITRGYVMNGLRQIKVPNWGQLVISALLFALYHTIWSFNVFSFIFSVIFGLLLGGLFLWGKRSLTPVIVAHLLPLIIAEPFSSMLIFLAPGA
jgi:membrane protease YdiL (CAAX protease family)